MNETETIINWLFTLINIIGFTTMAIDKHRAKQHQYRIPENTLWLITIFGGAIGTTIAMKLFRHKTKHTTFRIGFPLLAIVQIALYLYFFS